MQRRELIKNAKIIVCAVMFLIFSEHTETRADGDAQTTFAQQFANPPNDYRIIQYRLTPKTLQSYPRYGVGGYMAFFYKNYFKEGQKGRKQINAIVESARASGAKVWLADDWGYPSGMAGGKVVEKNPKFELRSLVAINQFGNGVGKTHFSLPPKYEKIIAAVLYPLQENKQEGKKTPDYSNAKILDVKGRQVTTEGLTGDWQLSVFASFIRKKNTQAQSTMQQFGHSGRYPDLMNSDAVASFLKNFHAKILSEIEKPAGVVEGFYCNEPNLMQTCWKQKGVAAAPWSAELPAKFLAMHGYEITPYLSAIFSGHTLTARRVRLHYRQTVTEMFAESFARQIATWCHERNLLSSGHFLLNDYLAQHVVGYGDLMRFVAEFDVPALDIPIPNPDQYQHFRYEQSKFFSSTAAWKKRTRTLLLLDPIIGGYGRERLAPRPELLINSINLACFNGVNVFTSYLPFHKSPGSKGYTQNEFRFVSEYAARLCLLLRGATRASSVALYYPIASFQSEVLPSPERWPRVNRLHQQRQKQWDQTQATLLTQDIDYTIVHPEAIEEAKVENGTMRIGNGSYRTLVIPHVDFIPLATMQKMDQFSSSGGKVIWVGRVAKYAVKEKNDATLGRLIAQAKPKEVAQLAPAIKNVYPNAFSCDFGANYKDVAVARYWREEKPLYLIINRTGEKREIEVNRRRKAGTLTLYNPETGKIRDISTNSRFAIGPNRAVVIQQKEENTKPQAQKINNLDKIKNR